MSTQALGYDDAMAILVGWEGRRVLVVAFVEPGVSLRPFAGTLRVSDSGRGVVRGDVRPRGPGATVSIAFPSGTFHAAAWVPGMEQRALSIEQGATRVDVFLQE